MTIRTVYINEKIKWFWWKEVQCCSVPFLGVVWWNDFLLNISIHHKIKCCWRGPGLTGNSLESSCWKFVKSWKCKILLASFPLLFWLLRNCFFLISAMILALVNFQGCSWSRYMSNRDEREEWGAPLTEIWQFKIFGWLRGRTGHILQR